MINQLLKIPAGWQGERPVNLVPAQDPDTYVYAGDEPLTQGTTIGLWDGVTGEPLDLDLDAYKAIRPLGNAADGAAVQSLDYHGFMGHAPRNLEPGRRYPAAEAPFDLEIRHQQITEGPWQGWGWRAEMHGDAGERSPGVRAIGVYYDPECTEYAYTTGAFVQGQSAWQVDAEGNPLTVWYTECPLGQLKQSKDDWHIAVLYASLQEGHQTLPADQDVIRYLFWQETQAGTQPPSGEPTAEWVDTGVTITQLVGAGVYRVSGVTTIALNQAIRLGATAETVFTGYWPVTGTPSDYIKIAPHVSAANGSKVWKWE